MQISLKGTNIQILESTREYVDRKLVRTAEKFFKGGGGGDLVSLAIEVEKTTKHHKKGDIFRAEASLSMGKINLRAESTAETLNNAIDEVEYELMREIKKFKEKRRTTMLKGARRVKGK
ncbi:MAG: ribosome-associated translation inhibitor RaiA [bacterium]|nr:ribosome-associated translation inhibitor RaiA [bacterium]